MIHSQTDSMASSQASKGVRLRSAGLSWKGSGVSAQKRAIVGVIGRLFQYSTCFSVGPVGSGVRRHKRR